jgi:hypothetical protein
MKNPTKLVGLAKSGPLHHLMFISDLRQITPVFSTNKIDSRDLAEILLKEVLRTITLSLTLSVFIVR